MDPFLTYLIKVSLIYLLCFVLYWLLFRRETFFRRNRVFLLLSLVLPALIPLIQFPIKSSLGGLVSEQGMSWIMVMGKSISEPAALASPLLPVETVSSSGDINIGSIISIIYIVGVLFFLLRMVFSYLRVIGLIASSKQKPLVKMILVITRKMVSPFSIFKWLVIPDIKENHPDLDKIVNHEMVHYKQKHSYDLLLSELVIAFQWFNPFAWMLKSSVVKNNEFLVDQILINGAVDQREYQYALLNNSIGQQNLAMVNGFSKGLIKKRIKMMNKRRTKLVNRIKEVLLLPFALIIILAFSAYSNKATDNLQDPDKKNGKKGTWTYKANQDKSIVKKGAWSYKAGQDKSIVKKDTWTYKTDQEAYIVKDDPWTISQDQDKKKKKKKKGTDKKKYSITVDGEEKILTLPEIEKIYGKEDQIRIYVDGKMVTLKGAPRIMDKDGDVKIIKLSDLEDLDGKSISKEKLIERIKEIETEGEKTIVMISESEEEGESVDVYAVISGISEYLDEGAVFVKKEDDGDFRISTTTTSGEGKVIYISASEGNSKKIHIRSDGKGSDSMILIDGEVSDAKALDNLDPDTIYSITILKKEEAVEEYGEKAKNGAIKIKTKK